MKAPSSLAAVSLLLVSVDLTQIAQVFNSPRVDVPESYSIDSDTELWTPLFGNSFG